jgi:hypothetical protein
VLGRDNLVFPPFVKQPLTLEKPKNQAGERSHLGYLSNHEAIRPQGLTQVRSRNNQVVRGVDDLAGEDQVLALELFRIMLRGSSDANRGAMTSAVPPVPAPKSSTLNVLPVLPQLWMRSTRSSTTSYIYR